MVMVKERIAVHKREAHERKNDFNEVSYGYNSEQALKEAKRCLMCKDAPCVKGCPVGIDIPAFIDAIIEDNIKKSYEIIYFSNSLAGVCGRICPQEDQCAKTCILGKKFEPVNIALLERYVADEAERLNIKIIIKQNPGNAITKRNPSNAEKNEKDLSKPSIGVIGAGPSGLTLSIDMAREGYSVVVYEALHSPGGVLRYGIPEFRLPNKVIDDEVKRLKEHGVEIKTSFVIGKTLLLEDMLKMHSAVFIGIGAGLPKFMEIPGENLAGVYSANEYLTRSNLMRSYEYPAYHTPIKRGVSVAVVGGGNVAMDSARTAVRLGAKKVLNIYRRSRVEMPARDEEIENAVEEGVELKFLTNPVEIIGNESGSVRGIRCIKMSLGDEDSSGRRSPVEIPGSEFIQEVDIVVMAIGTGPNRVLLESCDDLSLNKWGYINIDEDGRTNIKNVYAGGDIVTGSDTVISAMGAARKAALAMRKIFE